MKVSFPSACFTSRTVSWSERSKVDLRLELPGEFHFCVCRTNIIPILNEAQSERQYISQRWLIEGVVGS